MSHARFASITAALLARKGEAKPWEDPPKTSLAWREDLARTPPLPPIVDPPSVTPFAQVQALVVQPTPKQCHEVEFSDMSSAAIAPTGSGPEKIKKCTIRLSLHDYERLGIIAVKRNVTRQHLLHDALDQFFAAATEQYNPGCACLTPEACCQP